MKPITKKTLQLFLTKASEDLRGEWVVIGGTVLPLLGIDHRVTTDIDFVACHQSGNSDSLKLMDIAEKLGLPIESINQAGAYFLMKIPEFREHLIVLKKTKNCVIYRPDFELFLKLKIERLTESDLQDVLHYFEYTKENDEPFSATNITSLVKKSLAKKPSEAKSGRLNTLLEVFSQ
jgi:hypothetical protein